MRRGRLLIFLVLIVVVGLALLVLVLTQFAPQTVQPTPASFTEIYFAAQNIPQGATITEEMLGKLSIPPENVAEVEFTVGEEGNLIGQTARFTLEQGVIISSSMVGTGPVEISLVLHGQCRFPQAWWRHPFLQIDCPRRRMASMMARM